MRFSSAVAVGMVDTGRSADGNAFHARWASLMAASWLSSVDSVTRARAGQAAVCLDRTNDSALAGDEGLRAGCRWWPADSAKPNEAAAATTAAVPAAAMTRRRALRRSCRG
ncbi:MAG: hypothetical protein ACQSGP_22870 [Frankia sp.]